MTANITLTVITHEKTVIEENVDFVVAPGINGEFGAFPGHAPFLTILKTGILKYKDAAGYDKIAFINGGYAEVILNRVTILAESAERSPDIDEKRAREALERARRRLGEDHSTTVDYTRAKLALHRALIRLKILQSPR